MDASFLSILNIFTIFFAVLIILQLINIYFFRNRLIEEYLRLDDERFTRIYNNQIKGRNIFRLALWFSPVYLILMPLAFYFTLPELCVPVIKMDLGLTVMMLADFLYYNWIVRQLSARHPQI